jgi:hypothetical protein
MQHNGGAEQLACDEPSRSNELAFAQHVIRDVDVAIAKIISFPHVNSLCHGRHPVKSIW